jgi:hypothetical protein
MYIIERFFKRIQSFELKPRFKREVCGMMRGESQCRIPSSMRNCHNFAIADTESRCKLPLLGSLTD